MHQSWHQCEALLRLIPACSLVRLAAKVFVIGQPCTLVGVTGAETAGRHMPATTSYR